MPFGLDTFLAHLDQLAWNDLKQWNGGAATVFAGRNFLGGNFLWGHGEATDAMINGAHPEQPSSLSLLVDRIAPIQAPQPDRQQLTSGSRAAS